MAAPTRPALLVCLLLPLFLTSFAQNCNSDTFSQNRLYATCNSLPQLGASLHWNYYTSNQTVDIAYRAPQVSTGWVAWAINPTGSGMVGANTLFAFHDANGAVTVISTVINSLGPTVQDENLSFPVYSREAEYSNGQYTIYATVGLPNNQTNPNTVWQAGTDFQGGLPSGHPFTGPNIQSFASLDFKTGASASGGAGSSTLHQMNIHGVLTAVSWGVLFPIGGIIARYFKFADPAWFYLHIVCQMAAYSIGVGGWGLGIKLGNDSPGVTYVAHRDIGIALFAFASLQMFALMLRPTKDNKYRIYWNYYHYTVAYGIIILGIINIFKGFDILNPARRYKDAYIAVISALGGIAVVLEVVTWAVVLKRKRLETSKKRHRGANGSNANGGMQQQQAV